MQANNESFWNLERNKAGDLFGENILERLGDDFGGTYEVYSVKGYPELVVKRVKSNAEMVRHFDGDVAQATAKLKEEHEFVVAHMSEFVPRTVFLEGDLGRGREWFLVQERAVGVKYSEINQEFKLPETSDKLRDKFIEFRERYRKMRNAGAVTEDQIKIDFDEERIRLYDTNNLFYRDMVFEAEEVFKLLGDKPQSSKSEDIWSFLKKHFEAARQLDINNRPEFLKKINFPGETSFAIINEIKALNGERLPTILSMHARRLCRIMAYFPPADFEDNFFTLDLAEKLNIKI
jgi:hypothetical protein